LERGLRTLDRHPPSEYQTTGILDSIVLLILAIISFFITVFIVQVGAGLAGYTPSGDFVVLSAAILAAGAIAAGASPLTGLGGKGQ